MADGISERLQNERFKTFCNTAEACRITGLHKITIRKYADAKQIQCYVTPTGYRKYNRECLEKLCTAGVSDAPLQQNEKINFIYSRVSSRKQMDDLLRQTEYLRQRRPEYASYVSITDVASGINFKRKGLQTILDACLQGTVGELVVAHRDRLCRFGFELIESIVTKAGGKITVLDNDGNKSGEQELAEDLLSIIHVYSCKQMGKRSYSNRAAKISQNQIETQLSSENNIEGVVPNE
jgi:predicted site-specific integrase-resolvase